MKSIYLKHNSRHGLSLIEMMLAMAILAVSFIPIIGVMGSAAKATDKDNRTIKAMELCQAKLNTALQFPFDGPLKPPNKLSKTFGVASITLTAGQLTLTLGPAEKIDGISFDSKLVTTDIEVEFKVPVYDAFAKGNNLTDPTAWNWSYPKIKRSDVYTKYALTIKWKDKGSNMTKHYTLVSFKAKTRTN